jgi:hypothetical protein
MPQPHRPLPEPGPPFPVGTLVHDAIRDQVGEYRDMLGTCVYLRPVGGGREWATRPEAVRRATDAERITAGVRAANARSLGRPA